MVDWPSHYNHRRSRLVVIPQNTIICMRRRDCSTRSRQTSCEAIMPATQLKMPFMFRTSSLELSARATCAGAILPREMGLAGTIPQVYLQSMKKVKRGGAVLPESVKASLGRQNEWEDWLRLRVSYFSKMRTAVAPYRTKVRSEPAVVWRWALATGLVLGRLEGRIAPTLLCTYRPSRSDIIWHTQPKILCNHIYVHNQIYRPSLVEVRQTTKNNTEIPHNDGRPTLSIGGNCGHHPSVTNRKKSLGSFDQTSYDVP